jgi:hypothetical protein
MAGQLARSAGRWESTAWLYGASEALRESVGAALVPFVRRRRDEATEDLLSAAAEGALDRRWAEGAAAPMETAVCVAALELGMSLPPPIEAEEGEPPEQTSHANLDAQPPADRRDSANRGAIPGLGEYWSVPYRTQMFRLLDSLGLRYLARMLSAPNRELHVLDLAAAGGAASSLPRAGSGDADLDVDSGDAGPVLDARAQHVYQWRLRELAAGFEEAERWNDLERAGRARADNATFTGQLAARSGSVGEPATRPWPRSGRASTSPRPSAPRSNDSAGTRRWASTCGIACAPGASCARPRPDNADQVDYLKADMRRSPECTTMARLWQRTLSGGVPTRPGGHVEIPSRRRRDRRSPASRTTPGRRD